MIESEDTQALLSFVSTRDITCPACGYNLRMLSQPTCPECGLALKLTVGSDEPFKRAWAITLILNSLVAGIGLLFAMLYVFIRDFRRYVANHYIDLLDVESFFFLLGWLGPILWIAIPLLLMVRRQEFCRLSTKVQYLLLTVSVCWVLFQSVATVNIFNE